MEKLKEELEFDVLGFKLKMTPEMGENSISALEIVEHVRKEAALIKSKSPHLDEGQAAILVALKMAKDKLEIEREYRDNIDQLNVAAKDALKYVDQAATQTS